MDNVKFDRGSTRFSSAGSNSRHRYDYDNLPKFSGSSHQRQGGGSTVSTGSSPNVTLQLNERLPFLGSRKQMLNDNPSTRKFSSAATSTRQSSGYTRSNYNFKPSKRSETAGFFRRASDSITRNFSSGSDRYPIGDKPLDDVFVEFLTFLQCLARLVWAVLCKGSVWVLFGLSWTVKFGQRLAQDIPNPDWHMLKHLMEAGEARAENGNDESVDERIGHQAESLSPSPPVFSKYPGIARRLEELNKKEMSKGESVEAPFETVSEHYGTQFYPSQRKTNSVNLENTFLNIASGMSKRNLTPAASHANRIKASIRQITALEEPKGRPSFTRSTARFADLDWLKDDSEDYLNNLEYTRLFKEYQQIFEERNKMQELLKIKNLRGKGLTFKPLSLSKVDEIEEAWDTPIGGALITKYGIEVLHHDLLTLADGKWLNDKVIDFYLRLIMDQVNGPDCKQGQQKIHVFSTFFYSTLSKRGYQGVSRWAKRAKVDVSKLEYLFVPVNLNQMHWTLAYVDNVNKRFVYVDSLYGTGDDILVALLDYMTQETERVHGKSMGGKDYTQYELESEAQGPKQQNGFDCGVFACTAVAALARHLGFCYGQDDMPALRRKMAYEILKGRLED